MKASWHVFPPLGVGNIVHSTPLRDLNLLHRAFEIHLVKLDVEGKTCHCPFDMFPVSIMCDNTYRATDLDRSPHLYIGIYKVSEAVPHPVVNVSRIC
jgi:hypothetical protein